MQQSKPKLVQDIVKRGGTVFRVQPTLVNLTPRRRVIRFPWVRAAHTCTALLGAAFLIIGSVSAPTNQVLGKTAEEERVSLEQELRQLEAEINQHQKQIDVYRRQGGSLSGEIGRLTSTVNQLNAQIKAINVSLTQLNHKIGATESEIEETAGTIGRNQEVLAILMQQLYQRDQETLVEILMKHGELSDFFSNVNDIQQLQDNVRGTIGKITSLRGQLQEHVQELTSTREDVLTAQEYQALQRARADQVKNEKLKLLSATKGEQKKYETILATKKQQANQIRARLFSLLGGGAVSFGDAYKLASLAGGATGVRPALILAVLDRESALGRNVGKCNYKTSMSPANQVVFLKLMEELKINPDNVQVSCAILSDGAYGGAMGPAQFIPSTWQMYKSRIAAITQHNPPSPWNNLDAFTATALYLKDAGAANADASAERVAAARYYAGGNWARFLNTYGQAVISRANQFEDDIATITAN